MNMKKFSLLMILAAALISYACTEVEDNSESASLLVVSRVNGIPGGEGEDDGVPLLSDVCENPSGTPQDPDLCGIFNDNAEITFENEYLQIGPGAGFTPSFMNDIIVTQYRVDYTRANDRNTPGIDVPFGIDGVMNVRVPVNSNAIAPILIVRHTAKREPPLSDLTFGLGEEVLTAFAQMRFFGHDIAGRNVSATGLIEVHFANFAEPDDEPAP